MNFILTVPAEAAEELLQLIDSHEDATAQEVGVGDVVAAAAVFGIAAASVNIVDGLYGIYLKHKSLNKSSGNFKLTTETSVPPKAFDSNHLARSEGFCVKRQSLKFVVVTGVKV